MDVLKYERGIIRFNPRPPLRTGDTALSRQWQRARLGFNPRPPLRTGDTLVFALHVLL